MCLRESPYIQPVVWYTNMNMNTFAVIVHVQRDSVLEEHRAAASRRAAILVSLSVMRVYRGETLFPLIRAYI